ncbi:hypothetical protein CHELA20_50427 [Hyphomicrobiales bacterium]|jgi:hypothetical protein|nr:hypothetical protein CHELA20_50427 [Hyphomicrobiales bacterium]
MDLFGGHLSFRGPIGAPGRFIKKAAIFRNVPEAAGELWSVKIVMR